MFWGGLFLTIGILILLKVFFGMDIPIFKTLVGVGLIYLGVKVITSGSWEAKFDEANIQSKATRNETLFAQNAFDSKVLETDKDPRFANVFGKSTLNLKELAEGEHQVKLENVFGSIEVETSPETTIRLEGKPVFGSIKVRGERFGGFVADVEREFKGQSDTNGPILNISVESVFGSVVIK